MDKVSFCIRLNMKKNRYNIDYIQYSNDTSIKIILSGLKYINCVDYDETNNQLIVHFRYYDRIFSSFTKKYSINKNDLYQLWSIFSSTEFAPTILFLHYKYDTKLWHKHKYSDLGQKVIIYALKISNIIGS